MVKSVTVIKMMDGLEYLMYCFTIALHTTSVQRKQQSLAGTQTAEQTDKGDVVPKCKPAYAGNTKGAPYNTC